jgi:hypothetical protein
LASTVAGARFAELREAIVAFFDVGLLRDAFRVAALFPGPLARDLDVVVRGRTAFLFAMIDSPDSSPGGPR